MAHAYELHTGQFFGYLDDPRCCGPLPGGTTHVEFEGWRKLPNDPWQHTDPGPAKRYQPLPLMTIFTIQVTTNAEGEVLLLVRPDEIDFIKAHPSFRPAASDP